MHRFVFTKYWITGTDKIIKTTAFEGGEEKLILLTTFKVSYA